MNKNTAFGVLLLGVLFCVIPCAPLFAEDFQIEDGVLVHYGGAEEHFVIPPNLGITAIENGAFVHAEKAIVSITIPASVISIGDNAFWGCASLVAITVDEQNKMYSDSKGVLFDKAQTTLVRYPNGKQENAYVIPDTVTLIGSRAFYGSENLSDVTIPLSVSSIGNYAFSWCETLASVIIPSSVSSVGEGAFLGCISLSSVAIPDSISSIEERTFSFCQSLASITIPSSVTSIGSWAFSESGLTSIIIPPSVTTIEYGAFPWCKSLSNVTLPDSISSIGEMTFWGCSSLAAITIPVSVTSIGDSAFRNCSNLASIIIPVSVSSIEPFAFYGCRNLDSVTILANSVTLTESHFDGCTNIKTVVISKNVDIFASYFPEDVEIIYTEDLYVAQMRQKIAALFVLFLCATVCAVSCIAIIRKNNESK